MLKRSLQAESMKKLLYLLSTEARYLARGWEPVDESTVSVEKSGSVRRCRENTFVKYYQGRATKLMHDEIYSP